jgi:DNA modification methylase
MMHPYYEEPGVTIYHGDFREVLPQMTGESIEAVVTDPPYAQEFLYLWKPLAQESYRLLLNGGELITLLGHYQLPHVLETFSAVGFRYWWICGMHQTFKQRFMGKHVTICWKPALWFIKGKKQHRNNLPCDLINGDKSKQWQHPWEQGIEWFSHWCDRICNPGETILDPCMGSGTTLRTAKDLGRQVIGVDIDERSCEIAVNRLRQGVLPLAMA